MIRKILRDNMKRELKKWQKEEQISSRSLKSRFELPFKVVSGIEQDVVYDRYFRPTLHNKICYAFNAEVLLK